MAEGIARHAAAQGVKKLAFIGFNNALGETFCGSREGGQEARHRAGGQGELRAHGHLGRGADPRWSGRRRTRWWWGVRHAGRDAGRRCERGYPGKIYFNHGVANNDFLRVCGAACEGAWVPVGPVMVAGLLPDSHPVKASAQAFAAKYEAVHGAGSVSLFAAYTWDVALLLQQAVPVALKAARPARLNSARCATRWKM